MKITAIIPSRRSICVSGCVHAFSMLESGKHEVNYVICVDDDDSETIATAFDMKSYRAVSVLITPRLPALGMYHNLAAERFPADVYCVIGDDNICASWLWDEVIAKAVEEKPNGLWWFNSDPRRRAIYPIVSHGWYTAAGRIFTDFFPFWYDDVWLKEVADGVLGYEVPRLLGARLLDCPMNTTRMYDIMFWDDFFQATRPARIVEAFNIAKNLGIDRTEEEITRTIMGYGPNEEFRARAEKQVDIQGDKTEPGPDYLMAKNRAETIMQTLRDLDDNRVISSEVA